MERCIAWRKLTISCGSIAASQQFITRTDGNGQERPTGPHPSIMSGISDGPWQD